MEAKVKDVLNGVMVFAMLLISVPKVYAQEHKELVNSINQNLKYPESLSDSCVFTYANNMIEVDETGKIGEVKISDSAPEPFRKQFLDIKNMLKLNSVEKLVRQKKLANCAVIIPLLYTLDQVRCHNTFDSFAKLIPYCNSYSNKPYDGLAYYLKPIVINYYEAIK